jgi:L-alanine-DL-glutamate epimerase-like enolase superfamily enzyme
MAFALKLTHDEPKLVYLALVYHLGRPGSELDRETKLPVEHGLREVKLDLGGHVADDSAIIELDEPQYRQLLSAIYGAVNELRVYHMRNGAESGVARFTETARTLFPEIVADPEQALTVAEAMIMLHRRLERAVARASASEPPAPTAERRRLWPFRRG